MSDFQSDFRKMMEILSKELEPPKNDDISIEEHVYKQAENVACKYRRSLGKFSENSWKKIFYYIVRELAGYGPLHALFLDPNIEDISCNGVKSPIFVWHGKYVYVGNSVFAIGKTDELRKTLSLFGKVYVCSVDENGARVLDD
jgi:flagellar protein FlaI